MNCTPVPATSLSDSGVIPPDASSFARPADDLDAAAQLVGGHVVEQEAVGAGRERLLDVRERPALDLDRTPGGRRASARRVASPTPPASAMWFSLTSIAS